MKVVYEQLHNHLFQGQVIVHHSHTQNHKHKKILQDKLAHVLRQMSHIHSVIALQTVLS